MRKLAQSFGYEIIVTVRYVIDIERRAVLSEGTLPLQQYPMVVMTILHPQSVAKPIFRLSPQWGFGIGKGVTVPHLGLLNIQHSYRCDYRCIGVLGIKRSYQARDSLSFASFKSATVADLSITDKVD